MGKKWNKQLENSLMNIFAVTVAILPILSAGYFMHAQAFGDSRKVADLQVIEQSATPKLFREGIVSVTFDDGWQSVYTNAAPLLEEYEIRTTQYIMPGTFSDENYLSLKQAQSMGEAGHEIMSHTMTHQTLTDVDSDTLDYELVESKRLLRKTELNNGQIHFAAPRSAINDRVESKIKQHYISHRNTFANIEDGVDQYDVNVSQNEFDVYKILAYSVGKSTTNAHIKEALDYARDNNGWLVLVYHQVDESDDQYAVSVAQFEEHLRLVRDSGLNTSPLGKVVESNKELM